ncbi:MAG: 23S rRNA methyltransferase [Dermatophilus congolensis]|nr:23S rRNA methyltransferase [Dermatophilus congolensis]
MGGMERPRPGRVGGVRGDLGRFVERPIGQAAPQIPWEPEESGSGWAMLACPHCREPLPLARRERRIACPAGHGFDLAKRGYVSLLSGRGRHGLVADDGAMVAARLEVQTAGLYSPIRDALAEAARAAAVEGLPEGGLLDVGGGPGYYSIAVLESGVASYGVTFDLSSYAARRAARAHAGLVSVVADVWERWPLGSATASVALVVFAPRNPAELARVLAPGGVAIVVTPLPHHLSELRDSGMLTVDPRKDERLAEQFADFDVFAEQQVEARIPVTARQAAAIVGMGPSAHHTDLGREFDGEWAQETRDVTLAVRVATYRPRDRP